MSSPDPVDRKCSFSILPASDRAVSTRSLWRNPRRDPVESTSPSFVYSLENDHRDHTAGSLLVIQKSRPDLRLLGVQAVVFRSVGDGASPGFELLRATVLRDLNLDFRICTHVGKPMRMARRPPF